MYTRDNTASHQSRIGIIHESIDPQVRILGTDVQAERGLSPSLHGFVPSERQERSSKRSERNALVKGYESGQMERL